MIHQVVRNSFGLLRRSGFANLSAGAGHERQKNSCTGWKTRPDSHSTTRHCVVVMAIDWPVKDVYVKYLIRRDLAFQRNQQRQRYFSHTYGVVDRVSTKVHRAAISSVNLGPRERAMSLTGSVPDVHPSRFFQKKRRTRRFSSQICMMFFLEAELYSQGYLARVAAPGGSGLVEGRLVGYQIVPLRGRGRQTWPDSRCRS